MKLILNPDAFDDRRVIDPYVSYANFLKEIEASASAPGGPFYSADPVTHAALNRTEFRNGPRGQFILEYRFIKKSILEGNFDKVPNDIIESFVKHTAIIIEENLVLRGIRTIYSQHHVTEADAIAVLRGEKLAFITEYDRLRFSANNFETSIRQSLVSLGEPENYLQHKTAVANCQKIFDPIVARYEKLHPTSPQVPTNIYRPPPSKPQAPPRRPRSRGIWKSLKIFKK